MVEEVISPVAVGPSTVSTDNPWPGLLAFREADQGYFQGRKTETEELLRLVLRERLTVLFGLSGLGKSSLLQAGLFPMLRRETVFPVYIRLDFSAPEPDMTGEVKDDVAREALAAQIEAPPTKAGETLWEYFHRQDNDFWNVRNRPVVPLLVFDQFEEIFTLGYQDPNRSRATEALIEQLADLAEGRPPPKLKARLDDHPNEARAFSFSGHHYKILLSIREDFLPDLEALRPRMPALALNRLRLRRMNGEAAVLVVNQAPHLIDADVAEQVVRFVAADRRRLPLADLEVEPALLSVVCRELNNKRRKLGESKITAGLLAGSHEQVLSDLYENSVADLPVEVRCFIEDHLLTVSGYRDSVAVDNALSEPGVTRQSIDRLVERRLVRREDRGGVQRLELTHDLLSGVVQASRDRRLQIEAAEEQRHALEEEQEQEKRQRDLRDLKRTRVAAVLFLVLFLAAVAAAAWAVNATMELRQAMGSLDQVRSRLKVAEDKITSTIELQDKIIKAGELIYEGQKDIQIREYNTAIEKLDEAIKIDAKNPNAYNLKGYALMRMDNEKLAIKTYEQLLKLDPNFVWGHYNLALAYWADGEKEKAVNEVKRTLEIDAEFRNRFRKDGQFAKFKVLPEFRALID